MEWCKSECERQELEVTASNIRNAMADVIYNIRFPLIQKEYFSKYIENTDLLTSDEEEELNMFYDSGDKKHLKSFSGDRRRGPVSLYRFSSSCQTNRRIENGPTYSLCFKVSKACLLFGVVLYSDCNNNNNTNFVGEVKLWNAQKKELFGYQIDLKQPRHVNGEVEVLFPDPTDINAHEVYKLDLLMALPSKSGRGRCTEVQLGEDKVIYFLEATATRNGYETYEEHGQIPGIILM